MEDTYDLVGLQLGIFLHSFLLEQNKKNPYYINQCILEFNEPVDPEQVQQIWGTLYARHPILRAQYLTCNTGEVLLKIAAPVTPHVARVDFSKINPKARATRMQQFLEKDLHTRFDPEKAPLMRTYLVKLGPAAYQYVWTHHHILLDGYSVLQVAQEFLTLYDGKKLSPLPESNVQEQYLSYFQKQDQQAAQQHWQSLLSGYNTLPDWSITVPNKNEAPSHHRQESFSISSTDYKALRTCARTLGVTPQLVLQAAWGFLMALLHNTQDYVFGSVRALSRTPFQGHIGLLINTLPIRIQFNTNSTVNDLLETLRLQAHAQKQWAATPLEQIKAAAPLSQESPLFDVLMDYLPLSPEKTLSPEDRKKGRALRFQLETHYAIHLELFDQKDHLSCRLNYQSHHMDSDFAQRLSSYFITILRRFIQAPQQTLWTLSCLSPEEHRQQCHDWNGRTVAYPKQTVVDLFEQQVVRTPRGIALQDAASGKRYTFAKLNATANRLAHYLQTQGIRRSSIVTLYLPRSMESVIAVLAILKTGAAYLPLNLDTPVKRLYTILQDANTHLLLTHSQHIDSTTLTEVSTQYLHIDTLMLLIDTCPTHNLCQKIACDQPSYIVYTSGSTGQPKGVVNLHRGTANHLQWMQEHYPLTSADRILHSTPIAFDVAVAELLWPLVSGARLVIPPCNFMEDFAKFGLCLREQKITAMRFVPSLLHSLLLAEQLTHCTQLRLVIACGEILTEKTVTLFQQQSPQAILCNLYGPAETSIGITAYKVPQHHSSNIFIGQPISNTQIAILDHRKQLMPAGFLGEICISGAALAAGYLNRPQQTKARFQLHAAGNETEQLFYHSGDIGYWNSEGQLGFIGRNDRQVKIRGFRIELDEIERALLTHPDIKQTGVIVYRPLQSTAQLIAYYRSLGKPLPEAVLRAHLNQILPQYMVPFVFYHKEELPQNANGKLDYTALLSQHLQTLQTNITSADLWTAKTHQLAKIWQNTLGLASVNLHDHFFRLGGDSITAMQTVAQARQQGLSLTVEQLFNYPVLIDLANSLTQEPVLDSSENDILITPLITLSQEEESMLCTTFPKDNIESFSPLSPMQYGMLLHCLETPDEPVYLSQLEFVLEGSFHESHFLSALSHTIAYHSLLRTGFILEGIQNPLQVVLSEVALPFCSKKLNPSTADQAYQQYQSTEHRTPFTLSKPPLFRILHLEAGSGLHHLLFTYHHAIADGWSLVLLFKQIFSAYQALLEGNPPLTQPYWPYQDYLIWLSQQPQKAAQSYWKECINGFSESTRLEIDRGTSGMKHTAVRKSHSIKLSAQNTQKIIQSARSLGVSVNTLLQTAWAIVLSYYSNQRDIVFATTFSGRAITLSHIQERFGLFVQTVPVRAIFNSELTTHTLIQALQKQFAQSREFAHYPLVQLQKETGFSHEKPLLEYALVFENNLHTEDLQGYAGNLQLKKIHARNFVHFPLSALVTPGQQFNIEFLYDKNRFETSALRRFAQHFVNALMAITATDQSIAKLDLLSNAEKEQCLVTWNNTHTHYPETSWVDLWHRQIQQHPERVALRTDKTTFTYKALDHMVSRMQEGLKANKVKLGSVVAVCLPYSPERVAIVLAILKSGAIYCPLDEKIAPNLLMPLLIDADPCCLIIENLSVLSVFQKEKISSAMRLCTPLCLQKTQKKSSHTQTPIAFEVPLRPDTPSHLFYTSGSTGRPKGVLSLHGGLLNRLLWMCASFPLKQEDCLIQKTRSTFDVSLWELLWPLLSGVPLFIPEPDIPWHTQQLIKKIQEESISVLHFVPSLLP